MVADVPGASARPNMVWATRASTSSPYGHSRTGANERQHQQQATRYLAHEVGDDTVELGRLEALAGSCLGQLHEVLCSLGAHICLDLQAGGRRSKNQTGHLSYEVQEVVVKQTGEVKARQ